MSNGVTGCYARSDTSVSLRNPSRPRGVELPMLGNTARSLIRNPGFALASILALVLGIGANTAIFSLANSVLLRPLPYKDPSRLVMLWQQPPSGGENSLSAADFQDWRDRSLSFEHLAAFTGVGFNLTGGDRPEKIGGLRVTNAFFSTLRVLPVLGRAFSPEDEQPGAGLTVILSDGLWKRRFGGDPQVVGKTIGINHEAHTVIGVMPPGFRFYGENDDLWTPLLLDPNRANRNLYFLSAIGRLKPNVTLQLARAEMDTIARQLALEYPMTNQGWGVRVVRLSDQLAGNARPAILVLLGAVAFVLLIACANVANLLLVHAAGKQKEFAIRAALGAGRFDIVRRLLSESLILALSGGALGVLLAHWGIAALIALHPEDIPRLEEVSIDSRVLAFTVAVSLVTGILFGLLAAWQFSKIDLNDALNEGSRGASDSRRGARTRSALVIAEVALAMVLLIGAGLMLRSFAALETAGTGFPTANLLTMNIIIEEENYANDQQIGAEFAQVVEKIQAIPGVVSAAAATNLPVGDWNQNRAFTIEGRAPKFPGEMQGAGYMSVSPTYFRTVGIPLRRGREFTSHDHHGAPNVTIISESMARRFWPSENPIGKRIICAAVEIQGRSRRLGTPVPREIVGVVGDVQHVGRSAESSTEMYVPQLQNTLPFTCLIARTAGKPEKWASTIARAVNAVHKDFPVSQAKTVEELLGESFSRPRFQMVGLGVFAAMALLLATIGIYGVMAYSVTLRTHEIGIRMALGADARQVLELILRHGLKLAAAGVGIGLAASFSCTRLMASFLYNVQPTDAVTFAGVAALLIAAAAAASLIPAWRASGTDPASTLRGSRL
jgi:putative ABC transport system permease protein